MLKPVLAVALTCALALPAGATHLEGLSQHLEQNKDMYDGFLKDNKGFLRHVGFRDRSERGSVDQEVENIEGMKEDGRGAAPPNGAQEADKASLYGKPSADATPRKLKGLKSARQAGQFGGSDVAPIGETPDVGGPYTTYDPDTGAEMMTVNEDMSMEDMYAMVIEKIVRARCRASSAEPAFRALLWGAVVLDLHDVTQRDWPEMIEETRAVWEGHVEAVRTGRESFLRDGTIEPRTDHMPEIVQKSQEEIGATAVWEGGVISVGDEYAALGAAGRISVLFHEDEHHWDDKTRGGMHDNHWTGLLEEPDDTPSGKNWTETLAYRNMGDWVKVVSLGWPDLGSKKDLPDVVPEAF